MHRNKRILNRDTNREMTEYSSSVQKKLEIVLLAREHPEIAAIIVLQPQPGGEQ
jgi:hypothetical protein